MVARWASVLVVAGCGAKAAIPETPASAPVTQEKVEPPKPVCVAQPDTLGTIGHATSDGSQVQFCVGEATKDCFAVDLGSGEFHRLVEPPKVPASSRAHVDAVNPKLEVCTGGACTSLTSKVIPNVASLRAATNDDGSYAVVLLGNAPRGYGYAEVWNVAKTRRVALFRYARGVFRCGEVAMLENTIYLSASQCGQPAARAGLYALNGRKIANVGGKDFGSFGRAFVHLDGPRWAFLEENARQLVIQDVVKGRVIKKIDTTALFGSTQMGTPGESALVRLADGRLAIIAGSPATGSVALIDATTGEIKVVAAPACEAP